jgi:hypothetical protein
MNKKLRLDLNDESSSLELEHYLDEAIRAVLDRLKIRCKDGLSYDLVLLNTYYELVDKFVEHLKLIVKMNKGMR